ncbi:hypothetical protein Mal65_25840 [Crateriforma conspicua]|nr:hypothetical protein Mal65_25840 [Crateriforma conspicua]
MGEEKTRIFGLADALRFVFVPLMATAFILIAKVPSSSFLAGLGLSADYSGHLGGEYMNLAYSLFLGNGFSDPFGRATGPTAWMPPVIPALIALVLTASQGDMRWVKIAAGCVQWTTIACVLFPPLLLGSVLTCDAKQWRFILGAIVGSIAVASNFYHLAQFTHDHLFGLIFLTLLWLMVVIDARNESGSKFAFAKGFFSGVGALTHTVGGIAAIILQLWLSRNARTRLLLVFGFLLAGLPWCFRCYHQLGRFFPIKSNAGFDAYQALIVDDDGVPEYASLAQHPVHANSPAGAEYDEIGESEFVRSKQKLFFQRLQNSPADAIKRVIFRFQAFVMGEGSPEHEFLCVQRRQWKVGWNCFFGIMVVLLAISRDSPFYAIIALKIWMLFSVPYVLVSYYDRYGAALVSIQAIIVYSGVCLLIDCMIDRRFPILRRSIKLSGKKG